MSKVSFDRHMMPNSGEWTFWKKQKEMLVVLVLLGMEVKMHRVKYRDCSSPTEIKILNIFELCEVNETNDDKSERYAILQQMRNQVLTGYK